MKLKSFKPTSPGVRHKIVIQKNLLAKDSSLIKNLIKPLKRSYGRSATTGHITVWHKGGGVKRRFRSFDSKNKASGSIVLGVFFDPNRNAFISLNFNVIDKNFEFSLAPFFVYSGTCLIQNEVLDELILGSRTSLKAIPAGTIIHNIGSLDNKLGLFSRAAGTFCQLIQKGDKIAKIKLPSNQVVEIPLNYYATLGNVSNIEHKNTVLGKAGINRLKNKRPTTRGIAMNPVDHPHGGRTNGGQPCATPWGRPTKGQPTVRRKK